RDATGRPGPNCWPPRGLPGGARIDPEGRPRPSTRPVDREDDASVSVDGSAGELEALDRGIAALEQQREALGDSVVDTALRPLLERRRRLSGPAGERRKLVTVLFSDLADSTPLTTALGDEVMREVMGRYFAAWREAVEAQ